jgi:DNA topoisomerase-1
VSSDGSKLTFVGKKGVDLSIDVEDAALAKMLRKRAKEAGDAGRLFPDVSQSSLLDYTHSLDGGKFKTKDFRTMLGTRTAQQEIAKMTKPASATAYKKAVKAVATAVAKKLGNTPAVALSSYISPFVFAPWREYAPEK